LKAGGGEVFQHLKQVLEPRDLADCADPEVEMILSKWKNQGRPVILNLVYRHVTIAMEEIIMINMRRVSLNR